MKDKLTIQELAAYLPWEVEMIFEGKGGRRGVLQTIGTSKIGDTISIGSGGMWLSSCGFKPLLLPLSHLTNPINGVDGITWFDDICWNFFDSRTPDNYECSKVVLNELLQAGKVQMDTYYGLVEYLLKNHFDLFGLIKRGFAIDKTTIL